jgi:predicted kinase
MHLNPDHFLETADGRLVTEKRNAEAWRMSYEAVDQALSNAGPLTKVYVLVGPQGAGKSAWVRSQIPLHPEAVFFDAILVKRSERAPIIAAAKSRAVGVICAWLKTPLEVCLVRNAARPNDQVVPEQAVHNVHGAIEPPSVDEEFETVIEVPYLERDA